MLKKLRIKYGGDDLYFTVNEENLLYYLETPKLENINIKKEEEYISCALRSPFGTKPLNELINPCMKITIIVDDITRPTPQRKILPIVIKELNNSGIDDKDIKIIIALGTHRYMNQEEIEEKYGSKIVKRISIKNNEWKDSSIFMDLGRTKKGTPIKINQEVYNSDFVIGIGSISPHIHAGWSGGAKIIQPGVCGWETTGATHLLAPRSPELFEIAGNVDNPFRKEIEEIAKKVGLNFIVNTVVNSNGKIYAVVAGDPIVAHREGVKKAKEYFIRPIKELADIVIVSAYPGEIDYWAGGKAVFLSQRGLKKDGITILAGEFSEGIAPTHKERETFALKNFDKIEMLMENGTLKDLVCGGDLLMHARLFKRTKVICFSSLTQKQKANLGFQSAESIENALEMAINLKGENAKIGIINYGWEVLPELVDE